MGPSNPPILRVGVVADTHIPDRARALHPQLVPALTAAKVDLILHAGDISIPSVLEELEKVAPIRAVRGNRDWSFGNALPLVLHLELAGVPVILLHGHGGWWNYLKDKGRYMIEGYQFERYQKMMVELAPEARVFVFGHTHQFENVKMGDKVIFNPGTANAGYRSDIPSSIGFLYFYTGGEVKGEILKLNGFRNRAGNWEEAQSS
jgi:putative phosphoesterase